MPTSEFTPTLAQVGALVRTRTKDSAGNELGTFSGDTRPTAADVAELISQAVNTLSTRIGDDVPVKLQAEAAQLAALRAAMLIEISYFPEQVKAGKSPYQEYGMLWTEGFGDAKNTGSLVQAVTAALQNIDVRAQEPGLAVFSFPPPSNIGTRRM